MHIHSSLLSANTGRLSFYPLSSSSTSCGLTSRRGYIRAVTDAQNQDDQERDRDELVEKRVRGTDVVEREGRKVAARPGGTADCTNGSTAFDNGDGVPVHAIGDGRPGQETEDLGDDVQGDARPGCIAQAASGKQGTESV